MINTAIDGAIDTHRDDRLEMRWLPIVDGSGRTRMEAVWVVVTAAPGAVGHAA